MKFSTFFITLPLWLGSVTASKKPPSPTCKETVVDVDVAIIGGGSAGIHAAIHLKDAGASVLVVEKKDQIGGHAETYINPKTKAVDNIGVIVFENTDVVKNYFDRLKVPRIDLDLLSSPSTSKTYDFSLGIPIPPLDAAAQQQQQVAIQAAAQAYSKNVLSKYGWVDQGYFLPNPVPKDLYMPFGEFAAKNDFTALLPIMWQFNWYTGNLTTLPAIYGIKNFGPGLLGSTFGKFILSGTGNTRSLYDAALKELGSSVLLSSKVVSIDRHAKHGGVTLKISQPGKPERTVRAKKLLIAIPPLVENLKFLDLGKTENGLFSKFSALGYFTGVASVPGWNSRALNNVGAFTPFNQPIIPGANVFGATPSPDEFSFGIGFDTNKATDAEAEAVIRKQLATLAGVGAVPADAAKTVKFPATSFHKPFNLRVKAEDIKDNYYAKLLALQGSKNTYWAGAAWTGHNSALVWNFNEGTVLPALKKDLGLK